jgi:Carboxypeptidase regulatory-like domain
MLPRTLIACLLAAALSACAAGPALFGSSMGTVNGHLQVRACGGPNRAQQTECPARPMAGATLMFEPSGGTSSSTVTTDSAGAYRIDLKPGTYRVHLTQMGSSRPIIAANQAAIPAFADPRTVDVVAGKTLTEDFIYTIQLM